MAFFKKKLPQPPAMSDEEFRAKTKLEKSDIPAMIIAALSVLLPVALGIWGLFALIYFVVLKIWH